MYSIIKLENAMRWDDTAGQNLGWVNPYTCLISIHTLSDCPLKSNQTLTKFSILTPWSEFWLCGVNSDSVAWILTLRSEIWFCVVHFTPRRFSHRWVVSKNYFLPVPAVVTLSFFFIRISWRNQNRNRKWTVYRRKWARVMKNIWLSTISLLMFGSRKLPVGRGGR